MDGLLTSHARGVACCGHQTFEEMASPENYQLRWKDGRPSCAEGTLKQIAELQVGKDGSIRCDGDLVWPAFSDEP